MDHPLVLLEGPWLTAGQRRSFYRFAAFLKEPAQQRLALQEGYRPVLLTNLLKEEDSPVTPAYNVDPDEPKMHLKVPSPAVLEKIKEVWRLIKKPANIYLVVDVSASMKGAKIKKAKEALLSFVDQIQSENDKVALVEFSSYIKELVPLLPLSINRDSLVSGIGRLNVDSTTALYDAVKFVCEQLERREDYEHINAIVVMTDGNNTAGSCNLNILRNELHSRSPHILVFTVAYGSDADIPVLETIAASGNGSTFVAKPETIKNLYERISHYF